MATIKHRIEVAAPPETIWPLVSSAEGLARWWAADAAAKPRQPKIVELGFFNRTTVYRLRAERHRPPALAEWRCESGKEWSGTRISFHLTPSSAGSVLRFTHGGWRKATDFFVSCNTTWGELMFRLKAEAEGRGTGPLFPSTGMAY